MSDDDDNIKMKQLVDAKIKQEKEGGGGGLCVGACVCAECANNLARVI